MELRERDWLKRAKNGDADAFGMLVSLHERYVYNLALRTLGNPQDAQDVVQDGFVRAWMALPGFRADSEFRTWLYRIVLNLCLNRFPRLRRDLAALSDEELAELPEPASHARDVLSILEADEARTSLQREIFRLPESQRLLVTLRYQDELSYEEIASLVNLPLGTVKTGLFRARQRLRQALSVYQEQI
ncbi:MAG: sigma-70 family RNA polymerase sigma factor [Anaerolineales bacterium]|nr:sigma-70 family RNA polymerase sigma factor [Anaerolineales bacterium]